MYWSYGINVRSGNAYVVGPGFVHTTGVVYTVENLTDFAAVPPWTVEAVKAQSTGRKTNGDQGAYERFTLPDVIPDGERDTVLCGYASSLLSENSHDTRLRFSCGRRGDTATSHPRPRTTTRWRRPSRS